MKEYQPVTMADWRYKELPINTATLVERIEAKLRGEDRKPFSKEELEALHERLLEFLPNWG